MIDQHNGSMNPYYHFDIDVMNTLVGGQSVLGIKKLRIKDISQADQFLRSYGFDLSKNDLNYLWDLHRRAIVFLQEKLGYDISQMSSKVTNSRELGDIRNLILFASQSEDEKLCRNACSLLRVMHVFVHAETDLSSYFATEVQKQILGAIEERVIFDGTNHLLFLKDESDIIPLVSFDTKPFKTSTSTVIKLLAKPDALAMNVYDKLGVRFVTRNVFDSFRVIRFLTQKDLISFPHAMPDQSTNTLYPIHLFEEVCRKLAKLEGAYYSDEEMAKILNTFLAENAEKEVYVKKENKYSADNYKFIKFIARKNIVIENANPSRQHERPLSFFYPFEVQILDEVSFKKIQQGPSEHKEYKERQKQAALKRIFPEDT